MSADFEATLAEARLGDRSALVFLYQDLYPRLLRYLTAMDPGEGEDLASETWIDVATGIPRFRGDRDAFLGWAFTIARRRLLDQRRRYARRGTDPAPAEAFAHLVGSSDTHEEAMSELGTRWALTTVASLPPDQAEVLLLRVLSGLGTEEVARILGKRPGTVRVLQHRGLRRLADLLSDRGVTG